MPRNLDRQYRPMPVEIAKGQDGKDEIRPVPIAATCGYGVFGSRGGRLIVSLKSNRGLPVNGANYDRAKDVIVRTGLGGKHRSNQTKKRWTTAAKNAQKRIHEDKRKVVDPIKGKTFYAKDDLTHAKRFCIGFREVLFMEITRRMVLGRVVPLDFHNLYNDLVKVVKFNVSAREWAKMRSKDEDRRTTVINCCRNWEEQRGMKKRVEEARYYANLLLKDMRNINGEKKVVAQGQL